MNIAETVAPQGARTPRFALFEYGFRPFFLLVALSGIVAVPIWIAVYAGAMALPSGWPPLLWHGHEMVFGFAGAGVGGFMLTAVPNWTGAAPVRGARLVLLVAVWAAGRAALLLAGLLPAALVAAVDLALLPLLAALVARPLWAKALESGPRNLVFLVLLAALEAANLMTHLEALGVTEATALHGLHLGILVLALMVTMVGGRIIPSFTANALRRAGVARLPQSFAALEAASVASVALAAAIAIVDDGGFWFGAAALAAAAANAVRLAFWRPLATCRDPLLWVLHLGYAWLVAGLALSGAAGVAELVPPTAGLHALTVGGIATMLLAVMSRASLGHTGRPLVAPPAAVAAYALVSAAALLRILAAVAGGGALPLLVVSGLCFGAGFAAFLAVYAGPLLLARPDGKPG